MSHAHDGSHARPSIFSEHPLPTAIAVGVASLAPHFLLPAALSVTFAALLVALIAGIYFGFAVVNGSTGEQTVELSVAVMFMAVAVFGVATWPGVIALAYFGHAARDLAHHNRMRLPLVRIPAWYVPWCVIVDVVIGVGLLAIWRSHGIL